MTEPLAEIVQVVAFPPWTNDKLESYFGVHRLWQAEDPLPFCAGLAERVRGIATTAPEGADRALVEALPRLEIISSFSVGVDPIDLDCAAERGVIVTNTPDVLTDCVADLAMGLTLAATRRIAEGDRFVRAGHWLEGPLPLGTSLKGKTLGIVGLGRIGKALARRAEGFGMAIAYHGRHRQDGVDIPYYEDPKSLARASDVLVLTCPGGAETRHLVNAEVLQALGPRGFLVNAAARQCGRRGSAGQGASRGHDRRRRPRRLRGGAVPAGSVFESGQRGAAAASGQRHGGDADGHGGPHDRESGPALLGSGRSDPGDLRAPMVDPHERVDITPGGRTT